MSQQSQRCRIEALLKDSSFNLFSKAYNTMITAAGLHGPQARESRESHQASCQVAGHLSATSVLESSAMEVSISTIPCPGDEN